MPVKKSRCSLSKNPLVNARPGLKNHVAAPTTAHKAVAVVVAAVVVTKSANHVKSALPAKNVPPANRVSHVKIALPARPAKSVNRAKR